MSKTRVPQVGDVVWLFEHREQRDTGPLAAIIAGIDFSSVSVGVFTENGGAHGISRVKLLADGDAIPLGEYCVWPNFTTEDVPEVPAVPGVEGVPDRPAIPAKKLVHYASEHTIDGVASSIDMLTDNVAALSGLFTKVANGFSEHDARIRALEEVMPNESEEAFRARMASAKGGDFASEIVQASDDYARPIGKEVAVSGDGVIEN